MNRTRRFFLSAAIITLLATAGVANAAILLTRSLRQLAYMAEVVVIAEPLENPHPISKETRSKESRERVIRFRVVEVLKGEGGRIGSTIGVKEMSIYHLGAHPLYSAEGEKDCKPSIDKALLYLNRDSKSDGELTFQLVHSGMRYLTAKGQVLIPVQFVNPGDYYLRDIKNTTWAETIRKARIEIDATKEVLALKTIKDPSERNRKILDWIEGHRHEFWQPQCKHETWFPIERDVFKWILKSCIAEDCWRAVELSLELWPGSMIYPEPGPPAFGSSEGRSLLLRVARDTMRSPAEREQALRFLSQSIWWHKNDNEPGHLAYPGKEEQTIIIETLIPLLYCQDEKVRIAAVWAIRETSSPWYNHKWELATKQALPTLVSVYESEPPGEVRNALALAIHCLGGEEFWEELTGVPRGILVLIREFSAEKDKAHFTLHIYGSEKRVYESPVIMLERLNDDGKVLEKAQIPLAADYPKTPWEEGWFGDDRSEIRVTFSCIRMGPGTWKASVKGASGKGEQRADWISEPLVFLIRAPDFPSQDAPGDVKPEPGTGKPEPVHEPAVHAAGRTKCQAGSSARNGALERESLRNGAIRSSVWWILAPAATACCAVLVLSLLLLRRRGAKRDKGLQQ